MALIGGIFYLKRNGTLLSAKGQFTYNFGSPKNEAVLGSNGVVQGFKQTPTVPFLEGEITDTKELDVKELQSVAGEEITIELINGKVFILSDAHWASDGNITTDEGAIAVRFEGSFAEEFAT